MTRRAFHTVREGDKVTVARRLPARFDIVAETRFPPLRRGRLAHQIRQDLWRALRAQRGFLPVVEVTATGQGCHVRAGGQLCGAPNRKLNGIIESLLGNSELRQRWMAHAALPRATLGRGVARALRHTDRVD